MKETLDKPLNDQEYGYKKAEVDNSDEYREQRDNDRERWLEVEHDRYLDRISGVND